MSLSLARGVARDRAIMELKTHGYHRFIDEISAERHYSLEVLRASAPLVLHFGTGRFSKIPPLRFGLFLSRLHGLHTVPMFESVRPSGFVT